MLHAPPARIEDEVATILAGFGREGTSLTLDMAFIVCCQNMLAHRRQCTDFLRSITAKELVWISRRYALNRWNLLHRFAAKIG